MPCYTMVEVTVKDEAAAIAALKHMKQKATIRKNSDGTFTVTPTNPSSGFETKFKNEYGAALATKTAKAAGYTVTRKVENGEIELTLRQY